MSYDSQKIESGFNIAKFFFNLVSISFVSINFRNLHLINMFWNKLIDV